MKTLPVTATAGGEVAALVVHLALPEGAYITGQVYNVDGGWTV